MSNNLIPRVDIFNEIYYFSPQLLYTPEGVRGGAGGRQPPAKNFLPLISLFPLFFPHFFPFFPFFYKIFWHHKSKTFLNLSTFLAPQAKIIIELNTFWAPQISCNSEKCLFVKYFDVYKIFCHHKSKTFLNLSTF